MATGAIRNKPSRSGDAALRDSTRWIRTILRYKSEHPSLRAVLSTIERLQERPYRTSAVLYGEPGTGKEGLARALHSAMGAKGEVAELNAGGRSDAAVLEDLFGTRGRMGLAVVADRGTLFIDEVAGLGGDAQMLLYRLLKAGELPGTAKRVDLRVVAGSSVDLAERARDGRFRHDLYYRLARIVLHLPPLRQRREDIARTSIWIANRVLDARSDARRLQMKEEYDPKEGILLSTDAVAELEGYGWPGNLRELDAVMERALALYLDGSELTGDAVRRALEETGGVRAPGAG